MDGERERNVQLCCVASSEVVIMLVTYFEMFCRQCRSPIPHEPSITRDLYRHAHMNRILNTSSWLITLECIRGHSSGWLR